MNVKLALITLVVVVPVMLRPDAVVPVGVRHAATARIRDRIAEVLADLSESLPGIRVITGLQPPPPQRRAPPQRGRRVPRRQRLHRRRSALDVRAPTEFVGSHRPGDAPARRRHDGAERRRCPIGELTAFFLYLNAFFAPIQQLVQLYNTYQQGQAAIVKLRDAARHRARRSRRPRTRTICRRSTARSTSTHVTFGYNPRMPVLRDVDLHIARGRDDRPRRRDRRRQVDDRQARHALLRPDRGARADRRPRLRDVTFESLRRQLGVVPQEPFLFARHRARQHRLRSARRDRRRDRRGVRASRPRRAARARCPTASTRRARARRRRCRRASASCSRWRARSSPGRACWCSTRRRRTST